MMGKLWYDVDLERIGRPEITAWLDDRIERLRELGREPPPDYLALGVPGVRKWHNLFLINYGRILGHLDLAASFDLLPIEAVRAVETRLKIMLQGTLALVAMGLQRVGPDGG
jgi:hypothetical protein